MFLPFPCLTLATQAKFPLNFLLHYLYQPLFQLYDYSSKMLRVFLRILYSIELPYIFLIIIHINYIPKPKKCKVFKKITPQLKAPHPMRTKLSHWVGASLSYGDLLFVGAHQVNV